MEALSEDPFAASFSKTPSRPLRTTFLKTLRNQPSGRHLRNFFRNRLRKPFRSHPPFEDPLQQPARSLLSETLFEDPLRDVPKPPFEALRRTPRVPKPFRSRREALPSAPSKPSPEPPSEPFGSCQVSRRPARRPLFETPLGITFGARHVPPSAEAESQPRKPPSATQASRKLPSAP